MSSVEETSQLKAGHPPAGINLITYAFVYVGRRAI